MCVFVSALVCDTQIQQQQQQEKSSRRNQFILNARQAAIELLLKASNAILCVYFGLILLAAVAFCGYFLPF